MNVIFILVKYINIMFSIESKKNIIKNIQYVIVKIFDINNVILLDVILLNNV